VLGAGPADQVGSACFLPGRALGGVLLRLGRVAGLAGSDLGERGLCALDERRHVVQRRYVAALSRVGPLARVGGARRSDVVEVRSVTVVALVGDVVDVDRR